ncbi:helix-turn-helix transcriptional regulator [Priestia megaterium]|nr:helix-turn-helix transcriptional regulator [Priestia megaterium]
MKQDPTQAAFSHLLLSGTFVHEGTFREIQQKCGIYIHPHVVMLVSIDRYPNLSMVNPLEWKKEIGEKLVGRINETLTARFVCHWTEEGVLALLVELEGEEFRNIECNRNILRIAEDIQKSLDSIDISVSIGIGKRYTDPYMLHHSFEEAKKAMSGRFFQGNQLIFHCEMKKSEEELLKEPLTMERSELLALVRIGDEEGVITHVQILMKKIAEACNLNEDVFKSEVVDLVTAMSRLVLETGVSATTILSKNAHFIQDLYQTIRYDNFSKKVCEYAYWLTEQVSYSHIRDVSPIIRKAIQYMKEHHQESISLDRIAHYCCLSRYHFSHLFKKEVGVSVIDFLNRMRMEKALFYLEKTDLNVQEIANQVGFQDANYFSRMFKKYTNYSPTDYRNAR